MAELADHLTKESVHSLHDAYRNGVLRLREKSNAKKGQFGFTQETFNEVGGAILRYVHQMMWERSHPSDLPDFERVSRFSVSKFVRQEYGTNESGNINGRFVGDISRMLQIAGVARYIGNRWYLKPWDATNLRYAHAHEFTQIRQDQGLEDRIDEEKEKNKDVKVSRDLRSIKLPKEFTPESVKDFIERFVPAALAIQDELDELKSKEEADHWAGLESTLKDALG